MNRYWCYYIKNLPYFLGIDKVGKRANPKLCQPVAFKGPDFLKKKKRKKDIAMYTLKMS